MLARIDDGRIETIRVADGQVVFTQSIDTGKNKILMVPLAGGSVQVADGRGDLDYTLAVVKGSVIWKEIRHDKSGSSAIELFSAPLQGAASRSARACRACCSRPTRITSISETKGG